MMRKLLIAIALALMSQGVALAGIRYESLDKAANVWAEVIDNVVIGYDELMIATTGAISPQWDIDFPPRTPDEKTHFKDGIDTVIVLHRIECDTVLTQKIVFHDTTALHFKVECDTVFRVEFRPVWKEKVQVWLTPSEMAMLRKLLLPGGATNLGFLEKK